MKYVIAYTYDEAYENAKKRNWKPHEWVYVVSNRGLFLATSKDTFHYVPGWMTRADALEVQGAVNAAMTRTQALPATYRAPTNEDVKQIRARYEEIRNRFIAPLAQR